MKPKPFISIIVPIYQVEAYIEDCLSSIVSQTYQGQIECILIDDCSKDRSMEIAIHFIGNYCGPISFRIITHKTNRGLSAARNTGIKAAKGDYLLFLDSDDMITSFCIEKLADCLNEKEYDMVCGAFKVIGGYKNWWSDGYKQILFQSSNPHEIVQLYTSYKLYEMAWNKLINKQLLLNHNLLFQEGIFVEDQLWSMLLINQLSSIKTIIDVTYFYRQHGESIMNDSKKKTEIIESKVFIQEEYDKALKKGTILPYKENTFRIRREKNRVGKEIIHCNSMTLKEKVKLLCRLIKLPGSHHFIKALFIQ